MRSILGAFALLALLLPSFGTSCLAQANGDPSGALLGTSRAQEHAKERSEGKTVPTDPPKTDVTPSKETAQKDGPKQESAPATQASKQTKDVSH